jgi:HTH-type transcriptional regulator/antitoxin HigA
MEDIAMGQMDYKFNPNWISPPGDTIADILEDQELTETDLADKLNCSWEYVNLLIRGEALLSEEIAIKLAKELGGSYSFWRNREEEYRKDLAIGKTRVIKRKK